MVYKLFNIGQKAMGEKRNIDRINDRINRDDLYTMMESYKNMIETNLILVEKQDLTLGKIMQMSQSLDDFTRNLIDELKIIAESLKSVDNHHSQCAINQRCYCDELKTVLRDNKEDVDKKHMHQNLKIFGLLTLLCSIILGLVGLIYKLWPSMAVKP